MIFQGRLPEIYGTTRFWRRQAQRSLAALVKPMLTAVATPSPTDALIDLKFRRRLGRLVPIWRNVDTLAHLRVAPVPQRWPTSRGDARWLCIHPDVF